MKHKKLLLIGSGVLAALLLAAFLGSVIAIQKGVAQACEGATSKYNQECVGSLVLFVEDKENSFKDRNRAIWALGQLGDEKALPGLNNYYRGRVPEEKEYLDSQISQYELKKAINLLEGGINITAPFWR